MNFGLSEEQVALKATIKRYLEEQCPTSSYRLCAFRDALPATADDAPPGDDPGQAAEEKGDDPLRHRLTGEHQGPTGSILCALSCPRKGHVKAAG